MNKAYKRGGGTYLLPIGWELPNLSHPLATLLSGYDNTCFLVSFGVRLFQWDGHYFIYSM